MEERTTIIVRGKKLHLKFYAKPVMTCIDDLWDFIFEDFLSGAIEVNEDIWYIYYDGRCYETEDYVEE